MARTLRLSLAFSIVALSLPLLACAQAATTTATSSASSALSSTIRAELLSDPRTASLSQTQLDAMVAVLTAQAQSQGVTASEIGWHPQDYLLPQAASAPAAPACTAGFLCLMDEAYGFIGPAAFIAILLGLFAIALIWILAEMIHYHRFGVHGSLPSTSPPTPPVQG